MTRIETVADLLLKSLVEGGCREIYVNHGATTFPLAQAINNNHLSFIPAITESAGGVAALGGSVVTGRPGILIVTQGVGWYSGLGLSVYLAHKSGLPFIGIVGSYGVSSYEDNYHFQGFHLDVVAKNLAEIVLIRAGDDPLIAAQHVLKLAYSGTGKPVLIDISLEVGRSVWGETGSFNSYNIRNVPLKPHDSKKLNILRTTQKSPLLILGRGFAVQAIQQPKLIDKVKNIASIMGAGLATDSSNLGLIPFDDSHYVGIVGRLPPLAIKKVLDKFNGIRVLLGVVPDGVLTDENRDPYWRNNPFILVHPDKKLLQYFSKLYSKMIAIHADVSEVIEELSNGEYQDAFIKNQFVSQVGRDYLHRGTDALMYPELNILPIVDVISRVVGKRQIIHVFDSGVTVNAISYALKFAAPGSMITPHHCVGTAHNMAAGMVISGVGVPVFAHIGDGAALYGLEQLTEVQKRSQTPLIVLIYNNGGQISVIHGAQQRGYSLEPFVQAAALPVVDYVQMAKSLFLRGLKVDASNPSEIADAISFALHEGGVTVIEININIPHLIHYKGEVLKT